MESNKTKEALTVDYIFIPFSNQNDIEINEGSSIYKDQIIIKTM